MNFNVLKRILVLLTIALPTLCHPPQSSTAFGADWSSVPQLICSRGQSSLDCFRNFGTKCSSDLSILSPAPDTSLNSCTSSQCHCSSPPTTDPIPPQGKVMIRRKDDGRYEIWRIVVKLVCDPSTPKPEVCQALFRTGCNAQRRIIFPAYEELGGCTKKQCRCEANTISLMLKDGEKMKRHVEEGEGAVVEWLVDADTDADADAL